MTSTATRPRCRRENHIHTGYRRDSESGLYYSRARYYHPTLGTWTRRDPAGYVDGASLYQYVRGNPLTATDPTGRCEERPTDPSNKSCCVCFTVLSPAYTTGSRPLDHSSTSSRLSAAEMVSAGGEVVSDAAAGVEEAANRSGKVKLARAAGAVGRVAGVGAVVYDVATSKEPAKEALKGGASLAASEAGAMVGAEMAGAIGAIGGSVYGALFVACACVEMDKAAEVLSGMHAKDIDMGPNSGGFIIPVGGGLYYFDRDAFIQGE